MDNIFLEWYFYCFELQKTQVIGWIKYLLRNDIYNNFLIKTKHAIHEKVKRFFE